MTGTLFNVSLFITHELDWNIAELIVILPTHSIYNFLSFIGFLGYWDDR